MTDAPATDAPATGVQATGVQATGVKAAGAARWLLGIDGGASKSVLRLATPDLVTVAEMRGGPANIARDPEGAARAVEAGFAALLAAASLDAQDTRAGLHGACGLAGALAPGAVARFRAALRRAPLRGFAVTSDARTSCLGAHGGGGGAILAVGTGSVGYAIGEDRDVRVGGWGFPQGDEGGGAWIGWRAVRATLHARDGRRPPSPLTDAVERFAAARSEDLARWAGTASPSQFAALAALVIDAHAAGDTTAHAILHRAGREIAALADALPKHLPIALLGGLAHVLPPFLPPALRARLTPPQGDSAHGALLLAARGAAGR